MFGGRAFAQTVATAREKGMGRERGEAEKRRGG